MSAVKSFLKTYGTVGIGVYSGVTVANILGIYFGLRIGGSSVLLTPLETVLGKDSDTVQNIKQQLEDASSSNGNSVNWVREGTYLGIATGVDSFALPIKLAVCMPLAKAIIKRRA